MIKRLIIPARSDQRIKNKNIKNFWNQLNQL